MAIVEKHLPGAPCWAELCTSNLPAARTFYEGLFGWTSVEMPTDGSGAFVMLRRNGIDVGATYALSPVHSEKGISPHWLIYFCTDDIDATAKKVKEAGGGVLFGPFDVGPAGRSCCLVDRHGAMFAAWQPKNHIGSGIVDEPGTLSWPELATPEAAKSKEFYSHVFGWTTTEKSVGAEGTPILYTEWVVEGKSIGGCLQMTSEWKGIPPHWMPYFQVEGCAESCEKIRTLGGTVKYGPLPIEGVGQFAVALDPQGVVFSVIAINR